MSKKSIYTLYHPESHGSAFSPLKYPPEKIANHKIWENPEKLILSPEKAGIEVLSPGNFDDIKKYYELETIIIIDRIKTDLIKKSIIQITDHCNLSGKNPLTGKTPFNEFPQFPDISYIYSDKDLGLSQYTVNTVGTEKFKEMEITQRGQILSEAAAWISIPAFYVGINVLAIGWNPAEDKEGKILGGFLARL